MRLAIASVVLLGGMAAIAAQQPAEEAQTGFESRSNGAVDETTYQADRALFD
jgi:hypothetical protein